MKLIFLNNFPKFRNTNFQYSIAIFANYHLSTLLLHRTIHSPNTYLNFYRTNKRLGKWEHTIPPCALCTSITGYTDIKVCKSSTLGNVWKFVSKLF